MFIEWDAEFEKECHGERTYLHASSYVPKGENKGWSLIVLESFHNSQLNAASVTVALWFETAYFNIKFASLAFTVFWQVARNLPCSIKCVCVLFPLPSSFIFQMSKFFHSVFHQGSAYHCRRRETSWPLVFINKVLLEPRHAYLFKNYLWLLPYCHNKNESMWKKLYSPKKLKYFYPILQRKRCPTRALGSRHSHGKSPQ